MLSVTENAQKQIACFFEETAPKPIRVFLSNGCGGPQISMALDEEGPDDRTFEFAGVQYLVDKTFLTQAQPIEIDFAGNGFTISSSLELASGCGGCGSSGQCCS